MNDEWDQEVIILARTLATINSLGGYDAVDINNYQNLAKGYDLKNSVKLAKEYVSEALSTMFNIGKGSGPINNNFLLFILLY